MRSRWSLTCRPCRMVSRKAVRHWVAALRICLRVGSATPRKTLSSPGSTATRSPTVSTPMGSNADRARADSPASRSGVAGVAAAMRSTRRQVPRYRSCRRSAARREHLTGGVVSVSDLAGQGLAEE